MNSTKKAMGRFIVLMIVGLSLAPLAGGFTHPCIPTTLEELDTIKANLDKEPWKSGYASLAGASTSQLTWHMEGPCEYVSRTPDINLTTWKNDMNAIYNLARMWYFTGNEAYAQKAHGILLAWANTHTSFGGQEMSLSVGDYVQAYAGGASILRGTWPGWTEADTTTVKNYFRNVYWPQTLGNFTTTGPANKGYLNMAAGIGIAAFLDDTEKFNRIIDIFRTTPAAGLYNTLPIGVMGETGRDAGHLYGGLISATFFAEVAWKQGIDLYSEMDNRLLACGEYFARNTFVWDNPFVPFGTIDWNYYANNPYTTTVNRGAFFILQNAYKNRFGLPTPWIDHKMTEQGIDGGNFMYAKTADFSTATPLLPIVRPAVSPASSGLTLTTLGGQTAGRSVSYANGVWTMSGLGSGTWTDGADDCQFAYRAVTGDCAMVAKVTSASWSGNGNGKVGLMIRDNLVGTVSQRHWVGIVPNPANTLMEAHVRGWTEVWGGSNRSARSSSLPPGIPYWIKIERRGNLVTTYTSQDGASWGPWLAGYFANLPATINMGLFVCSGNATVTTATFEHVAFTDGTGGLVTTPEAPAGLLSIGSSKVVTLRWLQSYGATAYDLLRSTTSGSGYSAIASDLGTDKTSYVDTNVVAGTTYYYVVRAKNSAGTSGNSPEFYATLLPAPMVNLTIGGTASDNDNSTPPNAANAFDQNPGSLWFHQGATGWLQYDLGAGNAQVVTRYTFAPADVLIPARDPKDWQFQASNDGTNWTTLDTQINQAFPIRMQLCVYNIANTTAYRYYRFNITANNGDLGLLHAGEIGLWSDSGRSIPDGSYRIVSRNSNKVMDVAGGTNGAPVIQQTYNAADSQMWNITWQGNGRYRATNAASAKVIDNGGTSTPGANMVIQPWSGGGSQLWSILPDSDGFYRITSANSGLVAAVSGGSTADGANIIQGTYNGSDSQLWKPGVASAPQPIPPAPTDLVATAASLSQINLSWTASPGAISYSIKRATVSGGPYTTVAESVNTTNYSSTGLTANTTYYYVVSAVNGSGQSADSSQASATTLAAPPAAPTGLTAKLGENQVTLSWTMSAATTSYNVKRATTSGGSYTPVATGVTSTNYTDTGLTNGVTYYYVVSASNAIGTSPDSAEVSVTPSPLVVHLKFDEISGTIAADSSGRAYHATLVNSPSFGVGTFGNALVLVTNSFATAKYVRLPSGVTSGLTNFTVSTWVQMNSFETWQRIFDFGTGTGNYMFLTTQYTPDAPNNAKLRFGIRTTTAAEQGVSGTGIALSTNAWTHVAVTRSGNTVSLYVNGDLAGSGTITLNPSDLGVTTLNYLGKSQWADPYLDGNLDDFRLYSYAMSAGEIAAFANPSAGAPMQFAVVPGYGQATLTWLPNATTTYTVKRSTTSGGPYTPVVTGLTNLTYTDTGLTYGITYYYVVVGANAGGSGPDSAEVVVTPSNLGLHLKFDESAGSIAADSSFRACHATLVNAPTFTTGKINNALKLASSSSQYATLPTGVLDGLTNCSIMGWVKLGTIANWQRIFDFGTGTDNYMFLTTQYDPGANANKLRFAIRTPGVPESAANQLNSSVTTPLGSWAHVAVVLSGSTGRLYLNGNQVGLSTVMTLNPSSLGATTKNYLGKSQFNDPYLDGSLDDFRIYNYALSETEIADLATNTAPPSFTVKPINNLLAIEGTEYAGNSLAAYADDPDGIETVTFSKEAGPDWLTVRSNGTLSGVPGNSNVGANIFTVQVTDAGGLSDTATMNITVANIYSGIAGLEDLLGLASQWLMTGCTDIPACNGADLDGDADVDLADFSDLANNWLTDETLQLDLKFDETSGTTAADTSFYNRPGTLTNGPTWSTAGHSGGALSFDGVDDSVVIPNYNGIGAAGARTVSLWIKTSAAGVYQALVQWGSDAAGQLWYMRLQTDGTVFASVYAAGTLSSHAVNDGQWHHIAAVLDEGQTSPTQIRLYIDGQLDAVSTGSGTINTSVTLPVRLGVWYRPSVGSLSNYFSGLMDEVRIYNRALSATEIAALNE